MAVSRRRTVGDRCGTMGSEISIVKLLDAEDTSSKLRPLLFFFRAPPERGLGTGFSN